jgi:hypothetical protein
MLTMSMRFLTGTLLLASLACRPVLTIGWTEIVIILALMVILLGPALFKLYQRVNEFQSWKKAKKKK